MCATIRYCLRLLPGASRLWNLVSHDLTSPISSPIFNSMPTSQCCAKCLKQGNLEKCSKCQSASYCVCLLPPHMVKSKHNFDRHPSPKNANSPTGNLIRGAAILQTDPMNLRIPKTPMPSSSLRIAAIFSSTTPYRAT